MYSTTLIIFQAENYPLKNRCDDNGQGVYDIQCFNKKSGQEFFWRKVSLMKNRALLLTVFML